MANLSFSFAQTDSLEVSTDTTKIEIPPVTPILVHGSLSMTDYKEMDVISKEDIQLYNYSDLSEVLIHRQDFNILSKGYFGLQSNFSRYGSFANGNQFLFNGRNLNNEILGTFDLSQYPVEFFERMEILSGSEAVIFGENSTGTTINIQEMRYNSGKPYTKMWYFQGPANTIGADGIFSQNFHPKWNITLGARSLAGEGRFDNSESDLWNIRTNLRYNKSKYSSVSLNYQYYSMSRGLFGGINDSLSENIFDAIDAQVNFDNLNEKSWRHEIDLTYSGFLDTNKTTAFRSNLYLRQNQTRKNSEFDFFLNPNDSINQQSVFSNTIGVNGFFETYLLDLIQFKTGFNAMNRVIDGSSFTDAYNGFDYSTFAHGQLFLTRDIRISGGFKYSKIFASNLFSSGAKINFKLSDKFSFLADISNSQRAYTPNEMSGTGKENHFLGISNLAYKTDKFIVRIGGFYRNSSDLLLFNQQLLNNELILTNTDIEYQVLGLNLDFEFNYNNFKLISDFAYNFSEMNEQNNIFPTFIVNFDLSYSYIIQKSLIRGGINLMGQAAHKMPQLSPLQNVYLINDNESSPTFNGLNAYISMRLGSAFVKASFINLLNQGYYLQSIYPMPNRHFRFSVAWAFLD